MILAIVLPVVTGMLALAMALCTWRLLQGPGTADRLLALDTLYINALALLVTLGIWRGSTLYFEAALLIGLLGFVGTAMLARFVHRGGSAG